MKLRGLMATSAMLAVATLAAACSSSGSTATTTNTSSGASAGGSGANVATGAPIKLMATGALSSPSASYGQSVEGSQAAVTAINAAGGVNGHPLQLITCNDAADPNKASGCVQKAISDKVTALVGGLALFTAAQLPRLEQAGIPWVSPDTIAPTQMTSSASYLANGGSITAYVEAGSDGVARGGKNVVVLEGSAPGAFVGGFAVAGIKAAGGTASEVPYTIGQADVTAPVAQVLSKKPDAVVCACGSSDTAKIIKALRQGGFTGPVGAEASSISEADLNTLGSLAGKVYLYSSSKLPSTTDSSLAQFVKETSGVSSTVPRDAVFTISWLAVHIVADALKGKPGTDATSLTSALKSSSSLPTYGVVQDISFTKSGPSKTWPRVVNTGVLTYTFSGGKVVPVSTTFNDPKGF